MQSVLMNWCRGFSWTLGWVLTLSRDLSTVIFELLSYWSFASNWLLGLVQYLVVLTMAPWPTTDTKILVSMLLTRVLEDCKNYAGGLSSKQQFLDDTMLKPALLVRLWTPQANWVTVLLFVLTETHFSFHWAGHIQTQATRLLRQFTTIYATALEIWLSGSGPYPWVSDGIGSVGEELYVLILRWKGKSSVFSTFGSSSIG